MKRWLLLPPLFAVGLFFALQAFAGTKDTRASVNVLVNGSGQYELDLADIGDSVISSFTFQPAATLHVASIASVTSMNGQPATCQLGGGGFTCSVSLNPPPCPCMPGDAVKVLFTGSGEIANSVVQVMGVAFTVTGTGSVTTTSQTTTTRSTTTSNPPPPPPPPTPAAQKISGTVGPGAKIVLKTSAKSGKTMVTVRDLSKKDNFHLQGPGVNKKTGVAWTGTVTWPVMLKKGAYTFRSDAHPTLHGTLKVS